MPLEKWRIDMGGSGGSGFGSTKGSGSYSQYSGKLLKINKPDANADKSAQKLNGELRIKFENDPKGKEFDAVSGKYIAETKPALQTLNTRVRAQMKAVFEAAKETGRKIYYHFEDQPAQSVIDNCMITTKGMVLKPLLIQNH